MISLVFEGTISNDSLNLDISQTSVPQEFELAFAKFIKGADGHDVIIQYSADATSWHDSPQTGDQYIRFSTDGGTTWGNPYYVGGGGSGGSVAWGQITGTLSSQTDLANALLAKVNEPATEGTNGQVLTTDGNGGRSWTTVQGSGGTSDFESLENRPKYNGSVMTRNTNIPEVKTNAWDGKYNKPSTGIPKTDLASEVQASLGLADSALQESALNDYSTTAEMNTAIGNYHDESKQNEISDLSTIRSGAALGATALQSVPNTYRLASEQDLIDLTITNRLDDIEDVIPNEATESNKLADKDFVNSSISTNTAYFKGTLDATTDLGLTKPASSADIVTALNSHTFSPAPTNNDYCFVVNSDSDSDVIYDRFKYVSGTSTWSYEYSLNNSSFTASQWASVNSGITSGKVSSYDGHLSATNNPHGVTKAQVGLGNVPDTDFTSRVQALERKTKLSDFDDNLGSDPTHTHSQYLTQQSLANYYTKSETNTAISNHHDSTKQNVIDAEHKLSYNLLSDTPNVALQQATNNFISNDNEFDFANNYSHNNKIWFNYQGSSQEIKTYHFGNGLNTGAYAIAVAKGFIVNGASNGSLVLADGTGAKSIDSTPTSGSDNLITSGGVFSMIGNIESLLEALL